MLIVKKISKKYNKRVITNFSYIFNKGCIYAIVGPSGCGKSTLLNILAGINKSYKGDIYYNNINIKKLESYTIDEVGYVYQSYQLFNNMTVYENIIFPLIIKKIDVTYKKNQIDSLLKYFNVYLLKDKKVKDLSGGEKQRIALIRAILKNPDVLLLDEPTSALDENNSNKLMDYLQKIKHNKIIILVTHNNEFANKCDEIVNINTSKKESLNILSNKAINRKKTKLSNIKIVNKKVFKFNRFFSYIASSITTFSLICICLCEILKGFISDVILQSFEVLDTNGYVTVIENNVDYNIDFSKRIHSKYSHTYYQGLNSEYKKTLKETIFLDDVSFNDYTIKNNTFIFDNYMSNYKDKVVLQVSQIGKFYIQNDNYLYITYNNKKYAIKVDEIVDSIDDNFYIYCNNINYLNTFFIDNNLEVSIDNYLYSESAKQLYDFLILNEKYNNYTFLLDIENNIIKFIKNEVSRINNNTLKTLLNNNNINKYLISDYINTYIDFDTGFIYIFYDDKMIQVIIDDNLKDDEINISIKLKESLLENNKITIKDKTFIIKEIINQKTYPIIYINSNSFNSLNDNNNVYCLILYTNKKVINEFDNLLINYNLFSINNMKVFDYMIYFIIIYGLIIFLLSIIAISVIFNINFINKKKDVNTLYNLGIYKNKIVSLLLYEPINIVISSIITAIIAYFIMKTLVSFIYYYISEVKLNITISFEFLCVLAVFSIIMIITPLLIKIKKFLKK